MNYGINANELWDQWGSFAGVRVWTKVLYTHRESSTISLITILTYMEKKVTIKMFKNQQAFYVLA